MKHTGLKLSLAGMLPGLLLLFAIPLNGQSGPSLVLSEPPSWNGFSVNATVTAGFREHSGPGVVSTTDTRALLITSFGRSPGEILAMTPAEAQFLPGTGAAKDRARIKTDFAYHVGSATIPDSFSFNIDSSTSAMNALHNFGAGPVPADAFVEVEIKLTTSAPITGATLRLPGLPSLTAPAPSVESLTATFTGPVDGFSLPGHPAIDYPLTLPSVPPATPGRTQFTYTLTYSITTPFGSDPDMSYRIRGGAAGPPLAPVPALSEAGESVRLEMPVVELEKLIYDPGDPIRARVRFAEAADLPAHQRVLLACPETGDFEFPSLSTPNPGEPRDTLSLPIELQAAGDPTPNDGKLTVPKGGKFVAILYYTLSNRIGQGDPTLGIKPGNPFYSADFALVHTPTVLGVSVVVTPEIALSEDEDTPPEIGRRLGTIGIEGLPGIVQIASDDLAFYPGPADRKFPSPTDRLNAFLDRTGSTVIATDADYASQNQAPQWLLCRLSDDPAATAARAERIKNLPQLLALCGIAGTLHASNERTLATLATGLELWLEGYNCAINPRLQFHGDLSAPEGTFTAHPAVGSFNDSMLSPSHHYDDPLQELRRTFAEAAMQDSDANLVRTAFLDLGFAPNPDFRGFPRDIPQFNAQTGATGPGAAEGTTGWAFGPASGAGKWHGNGTVTVAGGVFGNRYGFAGSGGQMMQPMLYLMGGMQFAFEAGNLIERAVADGADLINISAGFPCRILSVLGPIGICSEDDRAALIAQINLLVAAANALICGTAPLIDVFLPGLGAFTCGLSTTASATLLSTFFQSLFASSALGNPRQTMERGIRAATAAGVPIVVSAGNRYDFESSLGELAVLFHEDNSSADDWEVIPAVIPEVISVGAVFPVAPYANIQFHGRSVDLWAPTNQPWLAPPFEVDTPSSIRPSDHIVYTNTGTSFSAPFVTGIVCQMMAVNPSLQRSRASASQRATLVTRLTGLLTSSATAPGTHPSVPASDPANPDVGVRGRLVHAWRAREAARADAGLPALDALGYNPRFARHDDENGPRARDEDSIANIGAISSPFTPRIGGLHHNDFDTYFLRLSQAGGNIPEATFRISVPDSTGPPPVLYNWDNPIRQSGAAGGETFYDFRLTGCEWHIIRLSTRPISSIRPGDSPLRSNDVLYKLQFLSYSSRLPALADFYDSTPGGNNTPESARNIHPASWVDHPGPPSIICSAGSKRLTISSTTLHGCEDVDWYRIPRWDGFDPASADWSHLQVTLSPPRPGVRLQLYREVVVSGTTQVEHTGAIGNGGADGVSVNGNANSLPLLLKVDGSTSESFDIVINHCITDSTFIDRARDAQRARGAQNPYELFEIIRQLRFTDFSVPRGFGLPETSDVLKFNWPRDAAGRSMLGQIHLVHHTGGPLRLRASPMAPDASIRFDFFDMNGFNVGSAATTDLSDTDEDIPEGGFFPMSAPMDLEFKFQPAGTYLLAISGFKLLDSWDFLLGSSMTLPDHPSAETPFAKSPLTQIQPLDADLFGAGLKLTRLSDRFGFSLQRGSLASFKLPEKSLALIEYSIDGVHWTEGGPVIPGSNLETLLPPPGGFARIRSLGPDPQILALSETPTLHLAFSTEPGSSYIIERSTDLDFWFRDSAFVIRGDGSTHSYPIFIGPDREFFRASEVFETGP
jgi:hypothetical protein